MDNEDLELHVGINLEILYIILQTKILEVLAKEKPVERDENCNLRIVPSLTFHLNDDKHPSTM